MSDPRATGDVLPFPEAPSASTAGFTLKESTHARRQRAAQTPQCRVPFRKRAIGSLNNSGRSQKVACLGIVLKAARGAFFETHCPATLFQSSRTMIWVGWLRARALSST